MCGEGANARASERRGGKLQHVQGDEQLRSSGGGNVRGASQNCHGRGAYVLFALLSMPDASARILHAVQQMQKYLLVASVAWAVTSCGNADETPALTREAFCQQWAERACGDQVVSACQAQDTESCRASQKSFCLDLVPKAFSSERANECLTAVGAAYADADLTGQELNTVMRLAEPCNRIVKGPIGKGGTCTEHANCDGPGGFLCVTKANAAQGSCQVPETVGAGLQCDAAQQICDAGFYCNGANCIAVKAVGQLCTDDIECGAAALCTSDGVCTARLGVSAPCTTDEQCLSELCYDFGGAGATCVDRLRLSPSEPACEKLR